MNYFYTSAKTTCCHSITSHIESNSVIFLVIRPFYTSHGYCPIGGISCNDLVWEINCFAICQNHECDATKTIRLNYLIYFCTFRFFDFHIFNYILFPTST